MKKIIIICLLIATMLALMACGAPVLEDESTHNTVDNTFIEIQRNGNTNLAYHVDTHVVYLIRHGSESFSFATPYYIYQKGALYGAVYDNGRIVPVPYATKPLN